MINTLKDELQRVANEVGITFTYKSESELEAYSQGHDFSINPIVNLKPVESITQNIMPSGAIRYDFTFDLHFLTDFSISNTEEDDKDDDIDEMLSYSEAFYRQLNLNDQLVFINSNWEWITEVTRQYTSNLLCGVKTSVKLDTACNRVASAPIVTVGFEYPLSLELN
jgi:hypothetical protein